MSTGSVAGRRAVVAHTHSAQTLTLKVYRGWSGLCALQGEWEKLARRCAQHYLHLPAWYIQKLKTEEAPEEVTFLAYFDQSRLVAVLPVKPDVFRIRLFGLSFTVPVAALYYPDEMGMCDATVDPLVRSAAFLQQLVQDCYTHLNRLQLAVFLRHLGAKSHLYPMILTASKGARVVKQSHVSKYLVTELDYESTMARYSKKFLRNLRRKERKLAGMGEVTYCFMRDGADALAALDDFFAIEASGWKGAQGSALLKQPQRKRGYEAMAEALAREGNLGVHLLKLDGRTIAAQLAVYVDESVYLLKIGFDETYTAVSPGFLLVNEALRRACASPAISRLSFVTGVGWTDVWKPETETIYCAYCFRWRWLNRLANAVQALRQARP